MIDLSTNNLDLSKEMCFESALIKYKITNLIILQTSILQGVRRKYENIFIIISQNRLTEPVGRRSDGQYSMV